MCELALTELTLAYSAKGEWQCFQYKTSYLPSKWHISYALLLHRVGRGSGDPTTSSVDTENCWVLAEGLSVFFRVIAPGRSTTLQWMVPHPCP